jgi:hypothetical protein
MNELTREQYFYSGKYFPNQLERLQNAYGKSFSTLDELRAVNAPISSTYMNYNLGMVGQVPIVETSNKTHPEQYLTTSGISSSLIQGQRMVNDRILGLGEYIRNNEYLQQFYPSIRVPK